MLVARYWTKLFMLVCALSYFLVYPFEILFPLVEQLFSVPDSAQVIILAAPCPCPFSALASIHWFNTLPAGSDIP